MKKLLLLLFVVTGLQVAHAQSVPGARRVLTISGDWKSQAWYQDKWIGDGKLYRGRYIAQQVNNAAPGKFEFVDMTNYEAQQYVDANYLSQFDAVVMGDVVGWSLPPRFLEGLTTFQARGGGIAYMGSWKWETALLGGSTFEEVLPARFGINSYREDWKKFDKRVADKDFVPAIGAAHPITAGIDWASAPPLSTAFVMVPKEGAQVLLKTPSGAPILAAWQQGGGRAVISSSIWANDQLSEKFGEWKQFGQFYAQMLSWLAADSKTSRKAIRNETGAVAVNINATQALNTVSARQFSIHASHDDPGLAPLSGEALKNFDALNLRGGFSRLADKDVENNNDDEDPNHFNLAGFNFQTVDAQLGDIKRMGLEPIMLIEKPGYSEPKWMWQDGAWSDPGPRGAAELAEHVAAIIEHVNGGKGGDPNYKLNLRYVEIANEPDINPQTVVGFVRLFKTVAERIHRDYPGVKLGGFGGYETPYLYEFMDKVGDDIDWISRHPYGWTGEMLFKAQDEYTAYRKAHNLKPVEFIITEWDFWIQGRPKFDYMMRRNFEAVKRVNLTGALHYRLGQYAEPVYLFGVLWTGSKPEKGAGAKGTPMHDAYDSFWAFRNFRGTRVPATVSSDTPELSSHLLADAVRDGDSINAVLYFDRGYDGLGWADYTRGVRYSKARVTLNVQLPPSNRARTVSVGRATGEGFGTLPQTAPVPAGATRFQHTLEIEPNTAISLSIGVRG
jgi:uncharacterized membrane protein